MTLQEEILHAADGLPRGHTIRTVCPFCHATHEKSFAITRDFDQPWRLLFMCHRGTCTDNRGYVEDRGGALMVVSDNNDNHIPAAHQLPTHTSIPESWYVYLTDKYAIAKTYLMRQGAQWDEAGYSLCMPWRNQAGTQIGWVEKRFKQGVYKSHHELSDRSYHGRLSFPRTTCSYYSMKSNGGVCVLVESLLDAYRIGEMAEAMNFPIYPVALLGAQISRSDVATVAALFDKVVVLLDPDQWPKGHIRMRKAFNIYAVESVVMVLDTDPKDATDDALLHLMGAIMGGFPWST